MTYNPKKVRSLRLWKTRTAPRRALKRNKIKRPKILFGLPRLKLRPLRLLKSLLVSCFFLFLFAILFFTWLGALFARNLPSPNQLLERAVSVSTKIYDRTGEVLLYDIHGEEKRTMVELENISDYAKWATIVAEDKNFYRHSGFDLKGIIRAVLVDLFHGSAAQGGSTITQQFIKNAVFTREKTYSRKIKELMLAYQVEKKFSKNEILKMYFNEIPYGSTVYGIEAASRTFFNKGAKDLDLTESTLLAALPKAPTYYSPYGSHTDELEGRARYIVKAMAEEGYLTREQAEAAAKENFLKKIKPREDNILAPHFSLYIKDLLTEKYGEQLIEKGGLKVITTLDWTLQQIAEEEIKKGVEKNEKNYNGNNAALVALDPKTGQVLVMVGSRDYFDQKHDGAVNVALRPRQPGSSFKPVVYAAAFTKGHTPETILYDVVTTFKAYPKDYEPHNYDGKEHGPVSMRQALAGSLNIPAVKTIYLTGVERVLDLADKLGYTTLGDRSRFGLSLVLGGAEVKLLEHTQSFATFAREGEALPSSFILRVEDQRSNLLEEWQPPKAKRVVEINIARQVIDILSDDNSRAFIFGSQSALTLPDRPVAAKTGTTNDWHDGWTLGFTPSLVAGVWVGNNNNTEMKRGADGVYTAGPIWNGFMKRALKDKPVESFTPPAPSGATKPILRGEGMGLIKLVVNKTSGKIATDLTPVELREERTFYQPHCILYFINKDDPAGPAPANPADDEQFENWEKAVAEWAKKQNYVLEEPPTQYDDLPTVKTQDDILNE